MRVVVTEIKRRYEHERRFVFDLDNGKYPLCYRSRVSSNAFFHSLKQRNWRGGKDVNSFEILYHLQSEQDFIRQQQIFGETLKSVGKEFPEGYDTLIELPNLWEFYKEIGWNYKTKKWIK